MDEYENHLALEMEKMKHANIKIASNSKMIKSFDQKHIKLNDSDPEVKIKHGSIGKFSFKHVVKEIK